MLERGYFTNANHNFHIRNTFSCLASRRSDGDGGNSDQDSRKVNSEHSGQKTVDIIGDGFHS